MKWALLFILLTSCEAGLEGFGAITLSPENGATDVALAVTVKSVFPAAITEPTNWLTALTLKKAGADTTLCSAVSYDTTTRTATCTHDPLETGANYTLAVSGISNAETGTSTFTTTTTTAVSSLTKSSVHAQTANNSITAAISFSSAVPAGLTPTVSVKDVGGAALTVSGCQFNTDRTALTSCSISGIANCTTLTDYTLTVSGTGFTTYTYTFNAVDDEFEADGITNHTCWTDFGGSLTASVANDLFNVSVKNSGSSPATVAGIKTLPANSQDIAMAYKVSSETLPSSCLGQNAASATLRLHYQNQSNQAHEININRGMSTNDSLKLTWSIFYSNEISNTEATIYPVSGAPAELLTAGDPFYLCMVRRNGIVRFYVSGPAKSYIAPTAATMSTSGNTSGLSVAQLLALDTTGWPTNTLNIELDFDNDCTNTTLVTGLDYVRFRTNLDSSATASGADCPPF